MPFDISDPLNSKLLIPRRFLFLKEMLLSGDTDVMLFAIRTPSTWVTLTFPRLPSAKTVFVPSPIRDTPDCLTMENAEFAFIPTLYDLLGSVVPWKLSYMRMKALLLVLPMATTSALLRESSDNTCGMLPPDIPSKKMTI